MSVIKLCSLLHTCASDFGEGKDEWEKSCLTFIINVYSRKLLMKGMGSFLCNFIGTVNKLIFLG